MLDTAQSQLMSNSPQPTTIPTAIDRLKQLTRELVVIRDALIARVEPGVSREADRQEYADTLIRFQAWCEKRGESMPLKLKRLVEMVMGETDAAPARACQPVAKRRGYNLSPEGRARIAASARATWARRRSMNVQRQEASHV